MPKFTIKKNTDLHAPTEDLNLQTHIFFATIEQHKGEVSALSSWFIMH